MYLTQSNVIRGLTKQEYSFLREMCEYSRNLYNVGLYNIRQHFFANKTFLRFESNYHVCKDNENYKLLQAGVSQQVLRVVDRSFKSFFNLIKKAKSGEYRFQDIRLPKYLAKGQLFPLILSTNAISISKSKLNIPVSNAFKAKHPGIKLSLPFPEWLNGKTIKEIRILPIFNGQYFKIQYVYEAIQKNLHLNPDNALGVDIGLENLATCVSNNGTAFIVDGRKLKSINHYWNKRMAGLQSINDKQGRKGKRTKQMNRLTMKRNNRCNDYIKKAARHIINHCIANDVGTIVVGYNEDFKRSISFGKRTNQQFTRISFGALREQLRTLCWRYCMVYVEQEESYTSKASLLDGDDMPVYNINRPDGEPHEFSGKRVKRGLYQAGCGRLINADCNGAGNILRKSKRKFLRPCIGLLASPQRILIA